MPSSRKRVVGRVSVGDPPKNIGKMTETIEFVVHNFKERAEERRQFIRFPALLAHGYKWDFELYPRDVGSRTENELVSCYLRLSGSGDSRVTAKYTIRCKGYEMCEAKQTFQMNKGRVGGVFLSREDILEDCLEKDGSLVFECDLQIAKEDRRVWYPEELQRQDILVELYQDAKSTTSDVVFSVGTEIYRAHKSILSLRCKKLYEIAEESGNDNPPIPIVSTREEIFKNVLDFVYTLKAPDIDKEETAIELLAAADLYDCVPLKLYVESIIVDTFLTATNAASLLMLADARSCALLKEAATNLFLTDSDIVKKSQDWNEIVQSNRLLKELLEAFMSFQKNFRCGRVVSINGNGTSSNDAEQLDVTSLREELQQANLEVDGSREVLVNRWKAHYKIKRQKL